MRLYRCLEKEYADGAVGIGFHLFARSSDGSRHIIDKWTDVAKELHHAAHTHVFGRADTEYRQYGPFDEAFAYTVAHFVFSQVSLFEIFVHQGFVVFGGGFHESVM